LRASKASAAMMETSRWNFLKTADMGVLRNVDQDAQARMSGGCLR